ncbi:hypothetical protein [Nonomuraea sp. NPDC050310]|uniref:hypothetical protein n=1 Tax=Nonomuraea sp. NPDC050310 TaxID=3154935 RepID=UPI003404B65B
MRSTNHGLRGGGQFVELGQGALGERDVHEAGALYRRPAVSRQPGTRSSSDVCGCCSARPASVTACQ